MAKTFTSDEIEQIALVRALLRSREAEKIRGSAGILRSEAAGMVPCHPSAIARWENGERVPRSDVALRLAEVYGEFAALASTGSEVA
jgi:transcriptional regulator with XRE-family HTH domain